MTISYPNYLSIGSLKEIGESRYKGEAKGTVKSRKTFNVAVKVRLTVLPNGGGILKLDLRKVVTRKFAILQVTYNKGDAWLICSE